MATVSVIVNSYDAVVQFLAEIDSSGRHTQLRTEATGLLTAVQKNPTSDSLQLWSIQSLPSLTLLTKCYRIKKTDLYSGVKVFLKSALDGVKKLSEFGRSVAPGGPRDASETAAPPPSKRMRQVPTHLKRYGLESTVGQPDRGRETEFKRPFFSTLGIVTGEMNRRFS
ncbi:hypothetical protein N1851_010532 [Merluccius polli]|uniref:Uncharacterized protein n=1 Tax=Merluccius polli TaxID=89951 RepID=A0AA47P676_MERPO|nr:hypothetical protein N1851_010532 [Merluccius polli]